MKSELEVENAITLYADMVKRICFMNLKKEADVDDIFQNVFFKFATNEKEFESSENEKAWLIRVTINECKSFYRSFFHRQVELTEDLSIYGATDKVHDDVLLQAVLKLNDKYRNVIYLHYYEGYKISEVASILKKNENTINTWLKRAKEQLKDALGGDYLE
ncbi:MAG: sigma-70 family RNA polymerase sigma factor [Erysipelotrichaceae bacterium]